MTHRAYFAIVVVGLTSAALLAPQPSHAGLILGRPIYIGLTNGLVGWWTFDGSDTVGTTTLDRSGNGNHGNMNSGPERVPGKLGQGLYFDGGTDAVFVPDSPTLIFTSKNFTISAWAKVEAFSNNPRLLAKGTCGVTNEEISVALLSTRNFYAYFRAQEDTTEPDVTGATTLTPNTWYHYIVRYDGAAFSLYVDGVLDGSTATTKTPIDTVLDLAIGARKTNSSSGCSGDITQFETKGIIDDVRIYNRALSADEIKRLYKIGGTGKVGVSNSAGSLKDGLVGWWTFDGKNTAQNNSGDLTFYDRSGEGNHASSTGIRRAATALGLIGQGFGLTPGGNDYASAQDNDSLDIGANQDFTLAVWVKTTQAAASEQWPQVVSKMLAESGSGYEIGLHDETNNGGRWYSQIWVASVGTVIFGATNVADGAWHHLVSMRRGDRFLVYEDGVLANSTSISTADLSNARAFTMGGHASPHSCCYFYGTIDDVRIYNRALSVDEIKRLYKMGATTKVGVANNSGSLEDGLVGYWTFDGKDMAQNASGLLTVYDTSGQGNHGTTTIRAALGKIGQGMPFNGASTDRVHVGNASPLQITGSISIASWVKFSNPPTDDSIVSKRQTSGCDFNGYRLGYSDSQPGFRISIAGTEDCPQITRWSALTTPTLNKWHHVVGVYDAAAQTLDIYINGALNNGLLAGTVPSSQNNPPKHVHIGSSATGVGDLCKCILDDVRIYNRALSADEIKRLYKGGR